MSLAVGVEIIGFPSEIVTTTAAGAYQAGNLGNFNPASFGYTRYRNENGDEVYVGFAAPIVILRANRYEAYQNDYYVSGSSNPGVVEVVLKRGSATVATAYTIADYYDGWWWVSLYDVYGNPARILAGDSVEVTNDGKTTVVNAPALTAIANPETDIVSGTGPADVVTTTLLAPHSLYVRMSSTTLQVTSNHSGAFSADFVPWGISHGSTGWLRYINPDGHYIYDDIRAGYDIIIYARGHYNSSSYNAQNYVSGVVQGLCGSVTVTLRNSAGAVKAQKYNVSACSDFSVDLYDLYGNPAYIEGGDSIEVAFGALSETLHVPNFQVTSDYNTDTISGSTDAVVITDTYGLTQTLTIWPDNIFDGALPKASVMPNAAGEFTAVFPGGIDPIQWGHLVYIDENANRVYEEFMSLFPKAIVAVRGSLSSNRYYGENYISAYVPGLCTDATVTLRASQDAVKVQVRNLHGCDYFNVSLYNEYGLPVNILPGDKVEVDFYGLNPTVVEVPSFDVISDDTNNQVTGSTNATVVTTGFGLTQTLAVWPDSIWDSNYGKYILTNGGAFVASNPFYLDANPAGSAMLLDWSGGVGGHLRYVDAGGNRIYAHFNSMYDEPNIYVQKDSNHVSGFLTQNEDAALVTLRSGSLTKAAAYAVPDQYGYFNLFLFDTAGNPVTIEEGDEIVVADAVPVTIPIPHLTAQVDVNTDIVSGEGPANAQIDVSTPGASQGILCSGAGAYSADFNGLFNIRPGDELKIHYLNADGNTIYIRFYTGPKLYAQLDTSYAWGYAMQANASLTVTLLTGTTVKGIGVTESSSTNYFSVDLYNTSGQPAIIEPGDTLVMATGGSTVGSMNVVGLITQVDAENDTLSGTGPANTALGVEVGSYKYTVYTGANGNWIVDPGAAGKDVTPGEQVLTRYVDTRFNETWLYATAPVVYVRADGSGGGDYIADNFLRGYDERRSWVNITLVRNGASVAVQNLRASETSGYYSTYLIDSLGLPADILDGDQIVIHASKTFTITVPEIDATVDSINDVVSGVGPANADLGIYTNGQSQTAHTNATGVFTATFRSIEPTDDAYIRYRNPQGHWIHSLADAMQTGMPYIAARWDDDHYRTCYDCVSGQAGRSYSHVSLSLKRGASVLATSADLSDSSGDYTTSFTNSTGDPLDILAGDVIEVSTGGETISMTVAALTVETNHESGVVYGSGPANAAIYLYVIDQGIGYNLNTGPDGKYYYDAGIVAQVDGYLRHTDASGNQTYLAWSWPYIAVNENGNVVYGYVERGVPVTVRVLNNAGVRITAATTSSNYNGYFEFILNDIDGDPLIIQPNDIVEVSAGPDVAIPVVPLSVNADLVNDRLTGIGPANANLRIYAYLNGMNYTRYVTTAADGSYTAEFSDEVDLRAGTWVEAYYTNDDGNYIYTGYYTPMIRINPVNDIVDGYATPNAEASLALKRGGVTLGTATAVTGMDGFFSAFFVGSIGTILDIQPGDVVDVTASPTNSATVAALSAVLNSANSTVTGSGPANAALYVRLFVWEDDWWTSTAKPAYTNSAGSFTVDFSDILSMDSASYAYVRYYDTVGNQSIYTTTPSWSPSLEEAENEVRLMGAQVMTSGFGTAHEGDLTTPLVYNHTGGSRLIINAYGGDLYVTRPDGSVDDSDNSWMVIDNPQTGIWKVQVRFWDTDGGQYAVAVGKSGFQLFMPVIVTP